MPSVIPAKDETSGASSDWEEDDESGLQDLVDRCTRVGHAEEAEWFATHGRAALAASRTCIIANIRWNQDFDTVVATVPEVRNLLPDRLSPSFKLWKLPSVQNQPYRIDQFEGRGLGILATRAIPAGVPILVERPSIVMTNLPPMGDQVWDPPASAKPGTDSEDPARKTITASNTYQAAFARLAGKPQHQQLLELYNCKPPEECGQEEGIMRTNQFGIELRVPKGSFASSMHRGLFLDMSRANHSCSPNMLWTWDVNSFTMTAFTLREIKAGEELTISYIDEKTQYATRHARLKEMYLFDCACKACSKVGDARAKSDERREEMSKINQALDLAGLRARWNAVSAGKAVADIEREFVEPLTRAYKLFAKEGLHATPTQALCSNALVAIHAALGNRDEAVVWAKKAGQAYMVQYWLAETQDLKQEHLAVVQKHKKFIDAAM